MPPLLHTAFALLIGVIGCAAIEKVPEEPTATSGTSTPSKPASTPAPTATPESTKKPQTTRPEVKPPPTPKPRHTRMFVGQEIPVPKGYSAPRISTTSSGGVIVQPSSPTSFQVIKTGVLVDSREGVAHRELEGFIDYGTPIRTIVPVYNEKGERVGTKVQEHPNPVLQPVIRTIQR